MRDPRRANEAHPQFGESLQRKIRRASAFAITGYLRGVARGGKPGHCWFENRKGFPSRGFNRLHPSINFKVRKGDHNDLAMRIRSSLDLSRTSRGSSSQMTFAAIPPVALSRQSVWLDRVPQNTVPDSTSCANFFIRATIVSCRDLGVISPQQSCIVVSIVCGCSCSLQDLKAGERRSKKVIFPHHV